MKSRFVYLGNIDLNLGGELCDVMGDGCGGSYNNVNDLL